MRELPFYTNWSYAHPRAIELAAEVASLAPGDLNRVFFVSGGSEAVEAAWKLARQYYSARGEQRHGGRPIAPGAPGARRLRRRAGGRSYDAASGAGRRSRATSPTTARRWARSRSTASRRCARRSSRSCPRCCTSATRTATTGPPRRPRRSSPRFLLDELEQTIEATGPETVCMVIMEPVQNAGGAFTPPEGYWRGVRELCDRYEILLCADEVITGFGRLGNWFGSERYDIRPDLVTCAKGLSSAYASIGAVIATDRVMEPFLAGRADVHARDHVRRPSGAGGDRAEEHRDHAPREDRRARRRAAGRGAARRSSSCSTCRSSATCAARASSTRSSSSRTRRRARRSPTRSASGCCAAS